MSGTRRVLQRSQSSFVGDPALSGTSTSCGRSKEVTAALEVYSHFGRGVAMENRRQSTRAPELATQAQACGANANTEGPPSWDAASPGQFHESAPRGHANPAHVAGYASAFSFPSELAEFEVFGVDGDCEVSRGVALRDMEVTPINPKVWDRSSMERYGREPVRQYSGGGKPETVNRGERNQYAHSSRLRKPPTRRFAEPESQSTDGAG